jgi:hypothetical protein
MIYIKGANIEESHQTGKTLRNLNVLLLSYFIKTMILKLFFWLLV